MFSQLEYDVVFVYILWEDIRFYAHNYNFKPILYYLLEVYDILFGCLVSIFIGKQLTFNLIPDSKREGCVSYKCFMKKFVYKIQPPTPREIAKSFWKNSVCHINFLCISILPTYSEISRYSQWLNSFYNNALKESPIWKKCLLFLTKPVLSFTFSDINLITNKGFFLRWLKCMIRDIKLDRMHTCYSNRRYYEQYLIFSVCVMENEKSIRWRFHL